VTANGAVSWIEYVASLAALYACPTAIVVVRRARNIKRVLILNCIPIAWPAALVMACIMPRKAGLRASLPASPLWTLTPVPPYGDGVSAAWDAPVNGQLAQDRCCVGLSPGPSRGTGTGSMATSRNRRAS